MAVKKTKRKIGAKPGAKTAAKTGAKTAAKTGAKKTAARKPAPKKAAAARKPAPKKPSAAKARGGVKRKPAAEPAAPVKKAWLHPPVVHWEIQAADPAKQRGFFSDLFGWSIDANNPQNYGMVAQAGEGSIGGGISGGDSTDTKPYVTFYVEVPDISAALAKAESLGAVTVMPRMDIGMVVLGQFRDPEGNVIGLIEGR
jgi:predicted enzyme related to lactoylglutathione lyase